jgi:hypothetical protein
MVKPVRVEIRGDQLHIEGYPDAVAFKKIDDPIARQLQAITLHFNDLLFCHDALVELARLDRAKQKLLVKALLIASIARYFKCFARNKSRTQLSSKKVLKNHKDSEKGFAYFQALRDKHIIHDENPYSQALTGVVLNPREAHFKVANVVSTAITVLTLDDDHLKQFSQLVEVTFAWVNSKRDELHKRLGETYEHMEYEDLLALPDIKYVVPSSKEVSVKR